MLFLRVHLHAGAKLFYLNGMRNGKYMNREVLNLARFISVMKFRPLNWRMNHPYLLTDRFEVGSVNIPLYCSASSLLPSTSPHESKPIRFSLQSLKTTGYDLLHI